ncbi:DMT family transporter, partial [Oleiphilus sp. HI0067]
MNNDSKGMLYGLIGILSFGLTLPVTRYVIEYFSPMFIGLGRATVAGIFAALLLIITRQSVPSKEQLYKLIIVALGVVVGFPVLSSVAMQTVPASHGGVVLAILPLATAIVGVVISNEKPSFGFWVTSVLGSMLVVIYSVLNGANALHWGDIALFFAVLSAAIGYSVGGLLSKEIGGWRVICWALVISTPFISIFALYHFPPEWSSVPI